MNKNYNMVDFLRRVIPGVLAVRWISEAIKKTLF